MNDRFSGWLCVCGLLLIVGCDRAEQRVTVVVEDVAPTDSVAADSVAADSDAADSVAAEGVAAESVNGAPLETASSAAEIDADALLAMRLPAAEAAEGWVRLFDGQTLFGWETTGDANFRVEDGKLIVDGGEQALLCTTLPWRDYELVVEFKAEPETNSGVFLRTPLQPNDPAIDCYEVNIAPDDNPFPTAGIVKRLKADSNSPQDFEQWRTMRMRLEGGNLQVSVDGQLVCDYTDPEPLPAARIGLQHNRGRVEFRSVKLRPLGLENLLDQALSQWTAYPAMAGSFSTTTEGWLHVQGGRTQLETKQSFGDFVLLAEYKLPTPEMNSGIFFRCIPGDEMMGYECQLSNEMQDGNRLAAADHGTGGIFRRQQARIVAGEVDQWTSVLLVAAGPQMAAWVAGVQVSDWTDDRTRDVNPRRGLRTDPGTIMIQGHDPKTDAMLKQVRVGSLD